MKYIIDLKKGGTVRGSLLRFSREDAMDTASEWSGRCEENEAVVHEVKRAWIAVYSCGELEQVVDDQRFREMEADGVFERDTMDWALVRDGKFYETLREAVYAFLEGAV